MASVDLGCYALDTGSSALGWGLSVGSHMIAGRTVEVPAKDQRGQARPSSGPTDVGSWQSGATPPTTTPPTTTPPGKTPPDTPGSEPATERSGGGCSAGWGLLGSLGLAALVLPGVRRRRARR